MSKTTKKTRTRVKAAATIPPFLHKIFDILENPEYNELISWNDDGNAFLIKNITEFTEVVLPKYFKHNNFASFVRQLNLYDFHKSQYNNSGSEFYHKMFKRGEKDLLLEIKRKIPNEGNVDSPPQLLNALEEEAVKHQSQGTFYNSSTIQDLISRQEKLEDATKTIFTQNKQLIKENKMLWSEVIDLKSKQIITDKQTKTIDRQNNVLLKENRCLWNEFVVHREKYERQVEKLILFLISIMRNSGHNMFKKKNASTKLNPNNEEEDQFEGAWQQANENNENFSVLPVKRINKQFTTKKPKSQLDLLLEHLEDEGISNLLNNKPFVVEDKELLMKLKTMLDLDTGTANFPTLEFSTDKRPNVFDHSFENEDTKERLAKLCKIEGDTYDSAVAIIREEKTLADKLELPKVQTNLNFDNDRIYEISSPMRLEDETHAYFGHGHRRENSPLDENAFLLDSENCYPNNKILMPPPNFGGIGAIHHDDDDEENENQISSESFKTNKLLEKSFSELDIHEKMGHKNDDNNLSWLEPYQNIQNNPLNLSSDEKNANYFFSSMGSANKLDQSF